MESASACCPIAIRQYEFQHELGRGSFSQVCKAVNTENHQKYAIKIFPRSNLADGGDAVRFQREINAMAFLRHENIVSLYDFFWDEKNYYMVMDLCKGGSLFDYIVGHDKLEEQVAAVIFKQIVSALDYCHSLGVAHRDLKPENILIDEFPIVKVSDFGLCGYISDKKMMKTFCGSPCYCSPECLCRVQYDGRLSDVWSLGVILYAMVTGEHPWTVANTSIMLRQIVKGAYSTPSYLSAAVKDLIRKMIQVNPKDRIKIKDIMSHPWLRIADLASIKLLPSKQNELNVLPPLDGLSLEQISEASARSSQRSDNGIISPFEDNDGEDGPKSSLPRLCIRCMSVEDMRELSDRSDPDDSLSNTTRKKIVPIAGTSLSNIRQRSAANFVTSRPKSKRILPMMTIAEDDS